MTDPIPVEPLYIDFFKFLDQCSEGDPWVSYQDIYLSPHALFFKAYWKRFNHFDPQQIAERVRQIKKEDYGQLRSLIQTQDPARLAEEAYRRCQEVLPLFPEPRVYLFVGFFSADGVTMELEGLPAIALGLERFQDFKDLSLLVTHEYSHCAQRLLLKDLILEKERPLLQAMMAEGLAVFFSEVVCPEIPLHRHLFISPERLQWARENQEALLELAGADLTTEKLVPVLFGPGDPGAGLPPRLGYFLAREMLRHCLHHHGTDDFYRAFSGFAEVFRRISQQENFPQGIR